MGRLGSVRRSWCVKQVDNTLEKRRLDVWYGTMRHWAGNWVYTKDCGRPKAFPLSSKGWEVQAIRATMLPSGYGGFPFLDAVTATSLPGMARKSLRLPSSWATEINFQSRCLGGNLPSKIAAASPLLCPDAGPCGRSRRPAL